MSTLKARTFLGIAAALAGSLGLSAEQPAPPKRPVRVSKQKNGNLRMQILPLPNKYTPHQSDGEIARRRSQIERGTLTWANGLRTVKS